MDADIQAKWVSLSALRKSYPGAPPPTNWVPQGVNVLTSVVQASQATIPQFFNFIESSAGNVQLVKKTIANVSAPPSIPITYPEAQCELGYYICPFDGTKKMTASNRLVLGKQREEVQKSLEQYGDETTSQGTTIAPSEAA